MTDSQKLTYAVETALELNSSSKVVVADVLIALANLDFLAKEDSARLGIVALARELTK